ncbi:MAG: 3-oxoacyl-[acyl-carrier-protein] reductase [Proteobacteria bacterium]|nr:3-oxoacyl-[acyl-carrier-protein] reductase [Pseudomonadota bacterium]
MFAKQDAFFKSSVLITGAAGGIGSAIVSLMHKGGAKIIAVGSNEDNLKVMSGHYNERFEYFRCDLLDASAANSVYDNAQEKFGDIDIVVCNAGVTSDALAVRMNEDQWNKVLQLNLHSTFLINRAAIKKMMLRRYGRIINISSIVASSGNVGQANYTAAKAGMIGMSKTLAIESASRGITVNCVSPGFIDTKMTADLPENIKKAILSKIPLMRMGNAEEVAHAVSFLAAKESSYITGQNIHVNGGMLMP